MLLESWKVPEFFVTKRVETVDDAVMLQLPPAPEPEQTLQQQTVEQPQSLTTESVPMSSSSAENSLLLQIQALTEQLLAATAVTSSSIGIGTLQPHAETTPNVTPSKVVLCLHFYRGFQIILVSCLYLNDCFQVNFNWMVGFLHAVTQPSVSLH